MTEDYHPPTNSELLAVIQAERTRLESLFEGFSEAQMTEPGVENAWSIKDIMAHIASWERMAFDRIRAAVSGEPLIYALIKDDTDVDRFNAEVYERNQNQSLMKVRAEFDDSHRAFYAQIEALSDEFLSSPLPFEWAGKTPAKVIISANSHWHYIEHAEPIKKWLDKQG